MREKIMKFCILFSLTSFSTPTSNHFWNLHKISENLIYNMHMFTKSQHRQNLSLLLRYWKSCFGMICFYLRVFFKYGFKRFIKKPPCKLNQLSIGHEMVKSMIWGLQIQFFMTSTWAEFLSRRDGKFSIACKNLWEWNQVSIFYMKHQPISVNQKPEKEIQKSTHKIFCSPF